MPKPPPLDPSLIENAPLSESQMATSGHDYSEILLDMVTKLQIELEETRSELERAKGSKTFAQVKTEMLKPYADAVFRFVMVYCLVVALLVLMAGYGAFTGFALPETILGIISGSTAVSVIGLIGLIGMVISGLFSASKDVGDGR
ncbi:hypothetical protein [Sphingobium yanoikuyae]|uniref:hypothetical protein n=1 Tax=Sphingobium yanoikuyae TaxID=13690 RepID=UPI0022DD2224|nr:hypothetical protein [Sphingobium yanoikuyae]WBQ14651.1 hypothetical protein PAE53_11940 [Sphingobium yanoikuyae]